jgi:hypothetical protein
MMPSRSWNAVLAKLKPYGIEIKWEKINRSKYGCYLVRIENSRRKTYSVDLSPNHNRDTVKVPYDVLRGICRRYKLEPSVLDLDVEDSE